MSRLAPSLMALCVAMTACQKGSDAPASAAKVDSAPSSANATVMAMPLGDIAGAALPADSTGMPNPYAHDPKAVAEGKTLFIAMNCAGCHAYGGGGAMGPDLTDSYWRYGGAPAQVFSSILEGRPQGMPSWGKALPPTEIWKLVTYIASISKAGATGAPETSSSAAQAGASEGTGLGRADRK